MDCTIFQSKEWEAFKLKTGYEKSYHISDILVLQKKLPLGRTMLYSPMVSKQELANIEKLEANIQKIATKHNSIFYRLELNIPISANFKLPNTGFIKSFEEMQPEHNWLIDLTQSEEEILKNMKQKGRYNIKIAERSALKITSSNEKESKELDAFYDQYIKTGKRHGVTYRNRQYFNALLEIFGKNAYAKAYTVWFKDEPLSSAVILYYGKSALYLYGASEEKHRNLMAPYFLHWEIIKEAKNAGFKEYNFLGIAPDDNPAHPWAGITRFKKQFGGFSEEIMGSYDLPIKSLEYQIFKLAEKIRR